MPVNPLDILSGAGSAANVFGALGGDSSEEIAGMQSANFRRQLLLALLQEEANRKQQNAQIQSQGPIQQLMAQRILGRQGPSNAAGAVMNRMEQEASPEELQNLIPTFSQYRAMKAQRQGEANQVAEGYVNPALQRESILPAVGEFDILSSGFFGGNSVADEEDLLRRIATEGMTAERRNTKKKRPEIPTGSLSRPKNTDPRYGWRRG